MAILERAWGGGIFSPAYCQSVFRCGNVPTGFRWWLEKHCL